MGAGRPESGLVFAKADGEPLDLDNLRRHFKKILRAARIEWARCGSCGVDDLVAGVRRCPACKRSEIERLGTPVRVYGLRHGFATAALEAGADNRTVADLMGHSSTRTIQDVYQHVSDARKREAADRIASELMGGGAT